MFPIQPKYIIVLSILLVFSLLSCNDNEIRLLKEKEIIPKQCYLKNADLGYGTIYNLGYDKANLLTTIGGFPDFDMITYQSGLPVKAISSFDKRYYISYEYDAKGALSVINFGGIDGNKKPFEYKSKVYTNTKKQIERIDLVLPVFDETQVTKIEYDANSNIKKVMVVENGKNKTIIENLTFDDKKTPYINTPLGNVMAYFTVYTAIAGGENTTYFHNKNNIVSAKVYTESGEVNFTYKYDYDENDYPTKAKVTRKTKGKEESHQENYTYICK